jgi:hypothetical protein
LQDVAELAAHASLATTQLYIATTQLYIARDAEANGARSR